MKFRPNVAFASFALMCAELLAAATQNLPATPPDPGPAPVKYRWQQRLPLAPNYAQLVAEARPAAQSGDADAQFALHVAFSFCRDGLRKRSAEELRRFPDAVIQDMHRRCDALAVQDPDLAGEADRWFALALKAGFPRALAFAARDTAGRIEREKTGGGERAKALAVARSRLVRALRANDPGVTFVVPNTLHVFFPGDRRVKPAISLWMLAACEQGLECGVNAAWMRDICNMRRDCRDGETGIQYAQRAAGNPVWLPARARALATMLRNSRFDEAAFAETVTSLPIP